MIVNTMTTVPDLLSSGTDYLSKNDIESPRSNTEQILQHILGINRVELYLHNQPLSSSQLRDFERKLARRAAHEPLQYILGRVEFMSLPFTVNSSVLIPRPETEILVETTIEQCRQRFAFKEQIRVLEIGTGSGCIAIGLAYYLRNAWMTSLDVSAEALAVARKNAQRNGVENRIDFLPLDVTTPRIQDFFSEKFDVLISNPPYVSAADFENLPEEIKNFEPTIALHDNADGLTFFSRIADLAPTLLLEGGFVALEVGLDQAASVGDFFLKSGCSSVDTYQDLNGIDRVVLCQYQPFQVHGGLNAQADHLSRI
ncbi:MAG: peptide chain release factor N(5)-glutamine methyltransferase [bacterium]